MFHGNRLAIHGVRPTPHGILLAVIFWTRQAFHSIQLVFSSLYSPIQPPSDGGLLGFCGVHMKNFWTFAPWWSKLLEVLHLHWPFLCLAICGIFQAHYVVRPFVFIVSNRFKEIYVYTTWNSFLELNYISAYLLKLHDKTSTIWEPERPGPGP